MPPAVALLTYKRSYTLSRIFKFPDEYLYRIFFILAVKLHWYKRKLKFSSYTRKFRMEQLQSHIWLTASSYMGIYLRISSYIRKPFFIYDFATAPLWISLYMRKIWFSFLSVYEGWKGGALRADLRVWAWIRRVSAARPKPKKFHLQLQ